MNQTQLNQMVWQRFIRMPYGHLLDYADETGFAPIPTPEECERSLPNPMGWWTPIENGAFFGGLYLAAQIMAYESAPTPERADQIHVLVNGLKRLQDVAGVEGCIARGVATDGTSHYLCSSDDQVTPWVFGLYTYYRSALCDERDEIRGRLLRTLNALWAHDGGVPCDTPYPCATEARLEGEDWRGACQLLFFAYVQHDLTGSEADLRRYISLRDGQPNGGLYTRAQIASHGFAHNMVRDTHLIQFWIDVVYHMALGMLAGFDHDAAKLYAAGCEANGVTALPFIDDMLKYDNAHGLFQVNWRPVCALAQPFEGNLVKARAIALEQNKLWHETIVPHRHMEHVVLGNALFGAWIALTCGNPGIEAAAREKLNQGVQRVDWQSLTLSYAFVAESCMITGNRKGPGCKII